MNTVEVEVGGKTITLETGRLAKQANGAVLVRCGDTMVLVSAVGAHRRTRGAGLLPSHGRRRGAALRRRQDPRRLHQARVAAQREGHPRRAPDRPAHPAAVPEGLHERGPRGGHRAVRRPREQLRRARHSGRLGGPESQRDPVPRPDRFRARRAHRGRVRDQPHPHRGPGRVRARPRGHRHQGRHRHGRGRREAGLRGCRGGGAAPRSRGDQEAHRRAARAAAPVRQAQVGRAGVDRR